MHKPICLIPLIRSGKLESENLEDADFDRTSLLKDEQLSAHWLHANFRIVFAKNKTREEFYYSLCLKSLIDILPQKAKQYIACA
jgi:uncharacterized protein (DUF362 family)